MFCEYKNVGEKMKKQHGGENIPVLLGKFGKMNHFASLIYDLYDDRFCLEYR